MTSSPVPDPSQDSGPDSGPEDEVRRLAVKNQRVMLLAAGAVVMMIGASFAAVPLYDVFCRVTGYGGATERITRENANEDAAGGSVADAADLPEFSIRFDANIDPGLDWRFRPAQRSVSLKPGVVETAFYLARSREAALSVGAAAYNVSPPKAGQYLDKVDCFCFTEQPLQPGEEAKLPVTFRIDPDILKDPNLAEVRTFTLSYTFYRKDDAEALTRVYKDRAQTADGEGGSREDDHDHDGHDHNEAPAGGKTKAQGAEDDLARTAASS